MNITDTDRINWLFASPKNFAEITDDDWHELRCTTEAGINTKSSADWFRELIDFNITTQHRTTEDPKKYLRDWWGSLTQEDRDFIMALNLRR